MKKLFHIDESEKKRILSIHTNATSRQYLSEQENNDTIKLSDIVDIAKELTDELVGNVKTKNLVNVSKILKDKVFGKKVDGKCAYGKVSEYFANTKTSRIFTWGIFVPGDYMKTELYKKIYDSEEGGEPQFNDIKKQLLESINGELNGFCRRVNEESKQSTDQNEIKEKFYAVLPCLKDEDFVGLVKGKTSNLDYYKFKKGGQTYAVAYDKDYTLYMLKGNTWDKMGGATCNVPKPEGGAELKEGAVLKEIGYVDSKQNKIIPLTADNNNSKNNPTKEKTSSGSSKLLKRGSNSEEVVTAKMKINKALPNVIKDLQINTSDLNFNDKTVAAVAYFQAKNGLKVDGIIGPETRGELSKI